MFSIISILNFFMVSSFHLSNNIFKIAHRGYSEYYGDNNILSFEKAVENNFDIIEMDIQLSKDNDIILYHDTYIDNKYVKHINTQTLVRKHNIITIDHFFENFNFKNIKINFDLKGNDVLLTEKLINCFKKYNVDTSLIYISSFNRILLLELINFKNINNMLFYLGFISSNIFTKSELTYLLQNMDFFVVDYSILDEKIIDFCHKNNIKVFTYTNKDIYTFDLITRYNVDGIFSDCKFPDINQI